MNLMHYRNYDATIDYSNEDGCLVGRVINVPDTIIAFHADSVLEIERIFHEMVDGYLADCAEAGQEPNKPYSGKLLLRLPPEQHAAIARLAARAGKSLNAWVAERLRV